MKLTEWRHQGRVFINWSVGRTGDPDDFVQSSEFYSEAWLLVTWFLDVNAECSLKRNSSTNQHKVEKKSGANVRSKEIPKPHAPWILGWRHSDDIRFHLNSLLLLLLELLILAATHLWVKWSVRRPPPESRGNEERASVRLFLSFGSFVHEPSREVREGDDSGSGRLTGSVSFRQEKEKKHTKYLCLSHFFLEKRKFRRRKPKRFHVSPPLPPFFFLVSFISVSFVYLLSFLI